MNRVSLKILSNTFGKVKSHRQIGEIIQEQSTNIEPLSSFIYKNLNYKNKIKVADIGCGFGRCINHLMNIVPKGSQYVGIDPLISNKNPFLKLTTSAGYDGKFICGKADDISKYPENYFDLILCNYSLYFFVDELPVMVRALNSKGLFITITHSKYSLAELLIDLQTVLKIDHLPTWNELGSEQVLDNFNAENGLDILKPYFSNIEKIRYKNELEFFKESLDNLFQLLDFKKTTLIHHNDYAEFIKTKEFDDILRNQISNKVKKYGKYTLNKDDLIFRCRNLKHSN